MVCIHIVIVSRLVHRFLLLNGLKCPRCRHSSACPLPEPPDNRDFSAKGLAEYSSNTRSGERFSCTCNSRVSFHSTLPRGGGVVVWKNGFSYTYWMPYKIRIYNVWGSREQRSSWTFLTEITKSNYYIYGVLANTIPLRFVCFIVQDIRHTFTFREGTCVAYATNYQQVGIY